MIHLDFETFSAAGYRWNPVTRKWEGLEGASKSGLPGVGAEVYASHPSTRVICLAWDGNMWRPGAPDSVELWRRVEAGETLSAVNSTFEYWIWNKVLVPKGWPPMPLAQIVDAAPRARAWSLPGSLAGASDALGLPVRKDKRGAALINKFCKPRNPTKTDPRMVMMPEDDPVAAAEFEDYCRQDVVVETALHHALPELSEYEKRVWDLDQQINNRGIPIDVVAVDHACEILRQADRVLGSELHELTGGAVERASQCARMLVWLDEQGQAPENMQAETVDEFLERTDLLPQVRRAVEIRQSLSSTSTKRVWAFRNRAIDGRIYGSILYCGANTGRFSGKGIQPHNFPKGDAVAPGGGKWDTAWTETFIGDLACRDYYVLADKYGDVLKALASSLRGFICS